VKRAARCGTAPQRDELATRVNVEPGDVFDLVTKILVGLGASDEEASAQALLLVEADLRGHTSHGLQRLATIVGRIRNGQVMLGGASVHTWRSEAVLEVDGRSRLGPPVAFEAAEAISERARKTGLAMAAVSNSNHIGMLAPYVEFFAERQQIGLVFTTSEALVHPWKGAEPLVGTNPIGIGVPSDEPLILDMATSAISMGKVLASAREGRDLQPGWAVDADGQETTDAKRAIEGALSPFGGAKGYGLAIALEALVGSVTRSALGADVRGTLDTEFACNKGDILLCIDPTILGGQNTMVASYLDTVRNSRPMSPTDEVSVPGDRARRSRSARIRGGIDLNLSTWTEAKSLMSTLSV
jgi:LDH2 family malate/lactate/ureidoglycolate dehydrogenase